jgi:hemoglobin-like flavoprotein
MTPAQIALIESSWDKVFAVKEAAAEHFYARLFELDPSLKPLFTGDMQEQGKKLMTMINVVVKGLTKLETLVPAVQDLGRRHAQYGVKDAHYDTVGAALLGTFQADLGPAFTSDVKDAWATAYGVLATTMKDAARAQA